MKSMKLVDKIGIPIFFVGIFVMFYFMRHKTVDLTHFLVSLAIYFAYSAVALYLCIKGVISAKYWGSPLIVAGLFNWFEYISTGRFVWFIGLFYLGVSVSFHFLSKRKADRQAEPS